MSMRYIQVFLLMLLVLMMQSIQAAEPKAGLWELSVTTSIVGSEQLFGPYHRSQCLAAEDVRNPEKLLADTGAAECSYGDRKFQGDTFSFSVSCGGALPMSGSGKVTYDSNQFTGEIDITADLQGIEVLTQSQVSGARTGDCAKN